jgi:ubiquinone/menaquinone biosynthesis C-methylase UbiE
MDNQKQRQVEYHERVIYRNKAREVDNSNPLVAWLNFFRLRKTLEMIGTPLAGKTVLSVCGGDGEEAEFFQRLGAEVTVADLSTVAMKAARVRNPALHCCCMDAESLSFADRSFDWVVVRDGLHHLARPAKGIYELERVSREGFAFLEGQDSLLVRLLCRVGIGENWDPAGGYVYRFSRREIYKLFSSAQTMAAPSVFSAWLPFGSDALNCFPLMRLVVYPVINQPLICRILTARMSRLRSICGL